MSTYYPSHNRPEHADLWREPSPSLLRPEPKTRRHKVSEAQLAANRANALKSTGPRTESGKNRCALNACRHCLTGQVSALTEEDCEAQAQFIQPIIRTLKPADPVEDQIALSIAIGHWRLNRIRATEDNIFALGHFGPAANLDVENPELHSALTQARVFLESSRDFERLTLYEQRIHRNVARDMAQLKELQTARKANESADSQNQQPTTTSAPNGSVFSTAETRAGNVPKAPLMASPARELNEWPHRAESATSAPLQASDKLSAGGRSAVTRFPGDI